MPVEYNPGDILQAGDLSIQFANSSNAPANVTEIYYNLYYVDPGPPETEVLVGDPDKEPANPSLGLYYASILIPRDAQLGRYRIRWTFQEAAGTSIDEAIMEFQVVSEGTRPTLYSPIQNDMIRQLRLFLRDNNPDRNYRFCPPEHEGRIGNFNRVFGYVWEDHELLQYLEWALDWWNMMPPETESLCSVDKLIRTKRSWRSPLLWGAAIHALFALSVNWIHDEFSVTGDTEITVKLPDGRNVTLPIEELHDICQER